MSRLRAAAAAAVAVFLMAGCSDSPSAPTTPIGVYVLATVDDDPMPAALFADGAYSLSISSGSLDVGADQNYVLAYTTLERLGDVQSEFVDSLQGTWTRDEMGAIQFNLASDNSTFGGVWLGREITTMFEIESTVRALEFHRVR